MPRFPSPPEFFLHRSLGSRIRYRPAEIAAIREHTVKAFALTSGNLTSAEQAERFIANEPATRAACEEPGPFLYAVHRDRIVRVFPT